MVCRFVLSGVLARSVYLCRDRDYLVADDGRHRWLHPRRRVLRHSHPQLFLGRHGRSYYCKASADMNILR